MTTTTATVRPPRSEPDGRDDRTVADWLSALLDAVPFAISVWDRTLRVQYLNQGWLRTAMDHDAVATELTWAQLSQRPVEDVVLRAAFEGRPARRRIITEAAGHLRSYEIVVSPVPLPDGPGIAVIAIDCSDQTEVPGAVRRIAARAAGLAQRRQLAAQLGLPVTDRLTGIAEELRTTGPGDPRRADEVVAALDEVIASVRATIIDLRQPPAGREALPMLDRRPAVQPLPAEDSDALDHAGPEPVRPEPVGLPAATLRAVLDAVPAAVTAWDQAAGNLFANRSAARWYGVALAEFSGRHASGLLGRRGFEASRPLAQEAIAGSPQHFVRSTFSASRGHRYALVHYCTHPTAGHRSAMVATVLDVSGRVAADTDLRRRGEQIAVLHERQRVAADLHDLVLQRLFGAQLILVAGHRRPGDHRARAADQIDAAATELRHAVAGLHPDNDMDLRASAHRVIADAADALGFAPALHLGLDTDTVPVTVGADAVAVITEALSNTARHSGATRVAVSITAAAGRLAITVADNGRGLGQPRRTSGLRIMTERAERHGGHCRHTTLSTGGTRVEWVVPLPADD